MILTTAPAGRVPRVPLGISMTSQGRLSAIGSVAPIWNSLAAVLISLLCVGGLLRRHSALFPFQRSVQCVPGKRGALDPHRKLRDAGKNGQLAQFSPVP